MRFWVLHRSSSSSEKHALECFLDDPAAQTSSPCCFSSASFPCHVSNPLIPAQIRTHTRDSLCLVIEFQSNQLRSFIGYLLSHTRAGRALTLHAFQSELPCAAISQRPSPRPRPDISEMEPTPCMLQSRYSCYGIRTFAYRPVGALLEGTASIGLGYLVSL